MGRSGGGTIRPIKARRRRLCSLVVKNLTMVMANEQFTRKSVPCSSVHRTSIFPPWPSKISSATHFSKWQLGRFLPVTTGGNRSKADAQRFG